MEALIEEKKEIIGKYYQTGFTPGYIKVLIEEQEELTNQIIKGKAAEFLNNEYLLLESINRD